MRQSTIIWFLPSYTLLITFVKVANHPFVENPIFLPLGGVLTQYTSLSSVKYSLSLVSCYPSLKVRGSLCPPI